MRPLLLALPLLLAGCIEPGVGIDPAGLWKDDGEAPRERDAEAYLLSNMSWGPEREPLAQGIRAGSFFQAWADGADYPTWQGPPGNTSRLVTTLTVDLYLRVTGPVVETTRFPDIMVYGGSGGAWMGFGQVDTPALLVPGETYRYSGDVKPPEGGLFVPRGERLGIKVVPVMTQGSANDMEILVGGATPSRVAWTEEDVADPPVADRGGVDRGELTGTAYAGPYAPDSVRRVTVVTLDRSPGMFLAWMNTTESQGIPDIDLHLEDENGTELAFSGTPTPREMLRLWEGNLRGPGEYRLVVTSYGSASAKYELAWRWA